MSLNYERVKPQFPSYTNRDIVRPKHMVEWRVAFFFLRNLQDNIESCIIIVM
jgi:hypothetical protein